MKYCNMALACLASLSLTMPGFCDKVTLNNGDSINGTIVRMEKEFLIFKTDAMGELTIKKSAVAALESENDHKVEVKGNAPVTTTLTPVAAAPATTTQEAAEGQECPTCSSYHIDNRAVALADIDAINRSPDTWKGEVGFDLSNISGNLKNETVKGNFKVKRPFTTQGIPLHELELNGSVDFSKDHTSGTVIKKRKGKAGAVLTNNLDKRTCWTISERVKWDQSEDLRARLYEAVGLGYKVIDKAFNRLDVMVGMDFARIDSFYSNHDNEGFFSLCPGYKWKFTVYEFDYKKDPKDKDNAAITLEQSFQYSPNLSELDDFLFEMSTKIVVPLVKDLKFTFGQDVGYDSQPVAPQKRDREWKAELVYEF